MPAAPSRLVLTDREDVKHGLKEVTDLDLVVEGGAKRGISVSCTRLGKRSTVDMMFSTTTL